MNGPLIAVGGALVALILSAGCWLGWQLLRQKGRVLLRLEELEKRLDELELGDGEEPAGLPIRTEAPAFELPDLAGDHKSLAEYRGQPLLLIFFNPACGFCRELLPKLAGMQRSETRGQKSEVGLVIVAAGDAEKNRQLFDEHPLDCPVLLQKETEVADAYQADGTPSGYLVSAEGKIASELAMGGEALLALAECKTESRKLKAAMEQRGGNDDGRADRFSKRSLTSSKLKRDGLKAGTPAPDFRLPRLDGHGELALEDLRGRQVLLVFSSPGCGPCNTLAPELEKFHRQTLTLDPSPVRRARGTAVVMVSKGEPKANRAKVKEYGLTFPVVLQQQWEVSRRYAMFATPIVYLIDETGVITHDVAAGLEPILALMTKAKATDIVPEPAEAQR